MNRRINGLQKCNIEVHRIIQAIDQYYCSTNHKLLNENSNNITEVIPIIYFYYIKWQY